MTREEYAQRPTTFLSKKERCLCAIVHRYKPFSITLMAFVSALLVVLLIKGSKHSSFLPWIGTPAEKSVFGQQSLWFSNEALLRHLETQYSHSAVWDYCWAKNSLFLPETNELIPKGSKTILERYYEGFHQNDPLVMWKLHSRTQDGRHIGRGGDVYETYIDGPSKIRPKIYDLLNGTYVITFFVFDAGKYNGTIFLRFPACLGFQLCNQSFPYQIEKVTQVSFEVQTPMFPTQLPQDVQDLIGTGRWVLNNRAQKDDDKEDSLLKAKWRWQSYRKSYSEKNPIDSFLSHVDMHSGIDHVLLHGNLKTKWILFLGDSLTMNSFENLIAVLLPTVKGADDLINYRYDRFVHEEVTLEVDRSKVLNFYYYRKWDIMFSCVTFPVTHPVLGTYQTMFPLIQEGVGISRISHVSMKWKPVKDMMIEALRGRKNLPHPDDGPDAVVFNFGLHFAGQLDPPLYEIILRHFLMSIIDDGYDGSGQKHLIWRSTGMTHFLDPVLSEHWMCRVPRRIDIMNERANILVRSLGIPILPFDELSATRPDAARDNRHYLQSNVRTTYNFLIVHLLNHILH